MPVKEFTITTIIAGYSSELSFKKYTQEQANTVVFLMKTLYNAECKIEIINLDEKI